MHSRSSSFLGWQLLVVVGVSSLSLAANADPGQVPCSNTYTTIAGCANLTVDPVGLVDAYPQTRSFDASHCAVVEGMTQPGVRHLLRFTFTTPNVGLGDLVVGAPADHPEWFVWSECHRHHHFRQYADYRLWTPDGYTRWAAARAEDPEATAQAVFDGHPELLDDFVAGNKMGFCVIDIRQYIPRTVSHFRSCSQNQGISVGWADEYVSTLDGQWIDVTGLPEGPYVLEAEVNAEHLYVENSYADNAAAVPVWVAVPA